MKLKSRQRRALVVAICLFVVGILLLSEVVLAGHHCSDEYCVVCMISSRENLCLALIASTFIAAALTLSLCGNSLSKKPSLTLVSCKVKLND